jgi:predicted AAA+ superfamily ATPase
MVWEVNMIDRPVYYKKIVPFIDKPFIKVLTGVRRCGKSTMMLLIQRLLKKRGVKDKQIISINFESMAFYHLRNSHSLYTYVAEAVKSIEGKIYLFFDEVQVVDKWEEAVNSFLIDFPSDIYITGSNSQLHSSELSTLLTGRYIHIEMQGLSFQEMITFREAKIGTLPLDDLLWLYIRRGGFPAIHLADYDEEATYSIITNIYDSIVLRDVVQRHNIRDIDLLNRVMQFITDTIGSTITANKIADYFKSQQRPVDVNTIHNYLNALVSSYIISKVNRYDIQGKELLKTQEKYYLADPGIQHAIFGYRDRHISGILENIVYSELVRRGYRVFIGKLGALEVDFIAESSQNRIYVQVAYKIESEETLEREFAPLLAIKDSHPKFVVTIDSHYQDTIKGIRHIGLLQFLTDDNLY